MKSNRYILMLEDDPDDIFLTQSTLCDFGVDVEIKFVRESREIEFIIKKYGNPYLILIDYNSYPDNAINILKDLKSSVKTKHVPAIVLSDSPTSKDALDCYLNGANSYIKKPSTFSETQNKINIFFKYWLEVADVPELSFIYFSIKFCYWMRLTGS